MYGLLDVLSWPDGDVELMGPRVGSAETFLALFGSFWLFSFFLPIRAVGQAKVNSRVIRIQYYYYCY